MEVKTWDESLKVEQPGMRVKSLHNLPLVRKPRTNLDKTSGKKPSDGLVKPTQELAKSMTENNRKVREPKTCDKAVNNPINGNRW